ncbi:MAG: prepilin-type N-terminal cleavage/methylation domain-containing protein [Verrucomicrobiae bacterium]
MKTPTNKLTVQRAFSLVELLVVIAVIAVIAAIAIPNISNITQSASEAKKLSNAGEVVKSYNAYAEAYYAASNAYPGTPVVANVITALNAGTNYSVVNPYTKVTNTFGMKGLLEADVATNKIEVSGSQLVLNPTNN